MRPDYSTCKVYMKYMYFAFCSVKYTMTEGSSYKLFGPAN